VFSGIVLCKELITHPKESYCPWSVVVFDLKTLKMMRPWSALGGSATGKKYKNDKIKQTLYKPGQALMVP